MLDLNFDNQMIFWSKYWGREGSNESPKPLKRCNYTVYNPKQRFKMGKYAVEHGPSVTVKKFSPIFSLKINESTASGFKIEYLSNITKKHCCWMMIKPVKQMNWNLKKGVESF